MDSSLGLPIVRGLCCLTDDANPSQGDETLFLNVSGLDSGNQFYSRFSNGYNLFTDEFSTVGVRLDASGTAWNPICDIRFKENLVEYEDTAGILQRVIECPVYTYHNKSLMKKNQEKEQKRFRITPTAQDFHRVFHPEDGTVEEQLAAQEEEGKQKYREARKISIKYNMAKKQQEASTGNKAFFSAKEKEKMARGDFKSVGVFFDENDEILMDQVIDDELTTMSPKTKKACERFSTKHLDMQELLAASLLCIKELTKKIDALEARMEKAENHPLFQ